GMRVLPGFLPKPYCLGLAGPVDPNILWRAEPSYAPRFAKSTFPCGAPGQAAMDRGRVPGKSLFRWPRAAGPTLRTGRRAALRRGAARPGPALARPLPGAHVT